jgi:hypothetical protein
LLSRGTAASSLLPDQTARARRFYRSQPKLYTPEILRQIQEAVGAEPTGTVTDELVAAVARFQAGVRGQGSEHPANRLAVDGMAGPRTLPVLFPTGLAAAEAMDEYTRDLVAFRGAMGEHDEELRRRLIGVAVGRRLTKLGIPVPAIVLGDENSFDEQEWVITYRRAGVKRIDVDEDEGMQLLLTGSYHEIRHCEQSFRTVQMLAGEGRTAAEIAEIMGMNPRNEPGHRTERVIAAAVAAPLAPGSMDALIAKGWFESVHGTGKAHRDRVLAGPPGNPGYRNLPEEFDAFYVADEIGDRFMGNPRGL